MRVVVTGSFVLAEAEIYSVTESRHFLQTIPPENLATAKTVMIIREFQVGEELALHDVFHSSVHALARGHYTPCQIAAWAPASFDRTDWVQRIRAIRPFVVEESGELVAYGDLQASGYIDHFYVAGSHARRGIGSALIQHICGMAQQHGISELTSDVSLCAEALFVRHGFSVVQRKIVAIRSVEMPNVMMVRSPRLA